MAAIRHLLVLDAIASDLLPESQPTEDRGPCCPHCGEPGLRLISQTVRPSLRALVAATYQRTVLDST